ncbi:hypothetical protein V2W45_1369439, partial [Cenococcum geophilum]
MRPYDLSNDQDIDELASLRQRNFHCYSMFHPDRVCFMIAIAFAFGACHLIPLEYYVIDKDVDRAYNTK